MARSPIGKQRFFVYIVESPSAPDLYHRRYESDLLKRVLELGAIPCVARLTISYEAFDAALTVGIAEEMENHRGLVPILHISAHGDDDGIELSDGDQVPWEELKELLRPINRALNRKLLVALSCCSGYSGIQMAMDEKKDPPYFGIVGSFESPTWQETAVAFASFYHLLNMGDSVDQAVEAMRIASGNLTFKAETAKESRKAFLNALAGLDTKEAQRRIQRSARKRSPGARAKAAKPKTGA